MSEGKRLKNKGVHPNSKKNLKLWEKGESGNPAGRPKGARSFKTVIAEIVDHLANANEFQEEDRDTIRLLEDQLKRPVSRREAMAYIQVVQALKGSTFAFNAIADREEGKPTQKIDADIGKKTSELTDEELDQLLKAKLALLNSTND